MRKIIIAGGSGFIGRKLCSHYLSKGFEVVVLTRKPSYEDVGVRFVHWNAKDLGTWQHELEGAELLINMNGRSVDCRYNEANKKQIYDSRIMSTAILGAAIQELSDPPAVWLNSSSATIYRHAEDRQMDEVNGEIGSGFSVDVCKKWEAAFFNAKTLKTRKVALRISIVLGNNGGALKPLVNLTRLGLGGHQGKGSQFFSWVHETDLIRAIDFIKETDSIEGPVNIAAPNPERNKKVMLLLRKSLGIPFGIPSPKWLLEIGALFINTETELILKSRNVIPSKLLDKGFVFEFNRLEKAFKSLVGRK